MTVKEMKEILNTMDEDKKVYISFLNGYSTEFSVNESSHNVYIEEVSENER